MEPELFVLSRGKWRNWLIENHASADAIWLLFYKKHTGKQNISYSDSVEEALCFGWIDGIKKSIDEQQYAHRFTPRRSSSKWSPLNVRIAKKMIEEGKMTEAGKTAFNKRIEYDEEFLKTREEKNIPLTPEIETALKKDKKAWENFNNLAPGYKKQYIGWLRNAKKQETLDRRLEEAIQLLSENKKLGMK